MTTEEYFNKGKKYLKTRHFRKAIMFFDKAIASDSGNAKYFNRRAFAKLKFKNNEGAIKDYNKAIELNPKYTNSYQNRGFAKRQLNDFKGAIKDYDKAIALRPNSSDNFYSRGIAKSDLKDFDGAITDYNNAISLDQNNAEVYNSRGIVKRHLKDNEGALKDYNKAIKLKPDFLDAFYNRGILKSKMNDDYNSINDYNKVIELDPNNFHAYNNRGNSKSILKDYEGAIFDYNKAIKLNKNLPSALLGRGDVKIKLKDYEGAISDFDKVIDLDPDCVLAYNKRGVAKRYIKAYKSAILDYDKAIKLDPEFAIAYNNRGNSKSRLKDYQDAIRDYDIAIKIDCIYKRAYYNRGHCKKILNDFNGALVDYDTAINLDPKYAQPWIGKLEVFHHQKNYVFSLKCLLRAIYLEYSFFHNQNILYYKHTSCPFFIFRQIQSNLPLTQYTKFADTIIQARKACLPLYTFITKKAISNISSNYNKAIWQRWLGRINYYCGDPLISYSIFKSFVDEQSKTLSEYYFLIQSCFGFVEDADPHIGKAILIAEKVKDENYIHPAASNPYLHYPLLQQYYAGLIFEIDEEPEDALLCFEKIAPYFLPAKYKQMQVLYDLDNKEASKKIRQEILDLEKGLNQKTGFSRGLETHTFNLQEDRIEKLFPHYFHYLEIEPAITHLVNLSKKEVVFILHYPGNQPNFWELFKVSPDDLDATRQQANFAPLLAQYKSQIEEYGHSFDPNNKPVSVQEDHAFRQTFKTLDKIDNKNELQLELGLHIQSFSLLADQYEELSTYFFVKGYLNNYEKLMLDFYALSKQLSTKERSPTLVAGLSKMIQSFIGKHLGLTVAAITEVFSFPPLAAIGIGIVAQAGVNFTAGSLAALFKNYYTQSQNHTIENFQLFKADFENFIAQEKERLGDSFEKRYPIQELYQKS